MLLLTLKRKFKSFQRFIQAMFFSSFNPAINININLRECIANTRYLAYIDYSPSVLDYGYLATGRLSFGVEHFLLPPCNTCNLKYMT